MDLYFMDQDTQMANKHMKYVLKFIINLKRTH